MQKILDELSSNEAFQYVQKLESEVDKLHKQLRDVTGQLQHAKVANASLSRSLDKNRVGTAASGTR
jgi:outer membrane murein-binding lipoprotein Lpp